VEELLKRRYTVTVADNLSAPGSAPTQEAGCEFRLADLRNDQDALHAFEGIDVCIALAARLGGIGFFNKRPAELLDDNARVTVATLFGAVKHRIQRLIYVSSSCVFDNSPAHPIAEVDLEASPAPSPGYPFSKLLGEIYCRAYHLQYGLTYTIVRPFNAYGPGEEAGEEPGDSHVIPDLTAKLLSGQRPLRIFGDGRQTRSFTHARDVARGIALALENPAAANEDFNLGHPGEVSILELAEKLWQLTGRTDRFSVASVPGYPIDVRRRAVDISKARRILGWEPEIDLDEGLSQFVQWFQERAALGLHK